MSLSIVIVNYNTKQILHECLENLQLTNPEAQVIVVDSGSSDGSAEEVKNNFPNVILVASPTNVGLAAGYNLGLAKATRDYILFLGTDAFPNKETIPTLISFMEKNPKAGLITCKLMLRDGTLDKDAHRGFPTPWVALTHFLDLDRLFPKSKLFNGYFQSYKNMDEPHEIDLCISHFMLIRKQVLLDVGPMDKSFFVYGEDVDFCYRIKEKGWQIYYVPQAAAIHYKGASVGVRKETKDITTATVETKKAMATSSTDAMKLFYKKHYLTKYPELLTSLLFWVIDLKKLSRRVKWVHI